PTFRGPIKNRSCTDVICCVLFLVFIAGYIVVGLVAWLYGDPRQVLYPRNSTGAYCGIGENREKPYLYYFNILSCITATNIITATMDGLQCPTTQVRICVSSCPKRYWMVNLDQSNQPVKDVFNSTLMFCQPSVDLEMVSQQTHTHTLTLILPASSLNTTNITQGINGLLDTLNAREISTKIFEDIARSWYWILMAVGQMMSTLFFPLLTFVLLLICVAYWVMTALPPSTISCFLDFFPGYLATSGQPQYRWWAPSGTDPGCQDVINKTCNPLDNFSITNCPGLTCQFLGYSSSGPAQRSLFNLQIYGILGLFWTLNWVLALGQCVLAGAFASFYWAFNKPQDIPSCPLTAAFFRTLRYHTGSLAFGALILTLVQIVRVVLEYLDHKLRGAQNSLIRCLMCCLKCCFWCLEKFIKFLNRNAYIMIAVYGKNFCISAKNAFMLLMRNIVRVVVLDKVTDLLLFFGKLLVVSGVGILSFFFFTGRIPALKEEFRSPDLNYYWLPIMVSILGAYVIASGFFSVFSMCVDTLFLCFLEDLERNDGSLAKPYYMSKNLMKILGKKNERPSGEKRKKAK
uniref:Choline transporter-like protein n=1 Tax=Vombatus ursinus TaxID=29139 RepID=A0A4X2M146_VOMUR